MYSVKSVFFINHLIHKLFPASDIIALYTV